MKQLSKMMLAAVASVAFATSAYAWDFAASGSAAAYFNSTSTKASKDATNTVASGGVSSSSSSLKLASTHTDGGKTVSFSYTLDWDGNLDETMTVSGVGKVTKQRLSESADDVQFLAKMRKTTEEITAIWGALDSTPNPERRDELIERYGSKLILASNTYASLIDGEGLKGPYVD